MRDLNEAEDPSPRTFALAVAATSNTIYFTDNDWLRRVNATTIPTKLAEGATSDFEAVGDLLFASRAVPLGMGNPGIGKLFRTDGTLAGTADVPGSPDWPQQLTNVAGTLFFTAHSGPNQATVLWTEEGTGTLAPTPVKTVSAGGLAAVGNRLFFFADDAAAGIELWTSDGTPTGTQLVSDICPGPCSGLASVPVPAGNQAFFVADDGVHGRELWRSDGTAAGTYLVEDLVPPFINDPLREMTALGDLVLFANGVPYGDPVGGLWRSDGTANGTFLLRSNLDVRTLPSGGPPAIISAAGRAFVVARELATGRELWTTDGTVNGTVRLTDGCAGACDFLTQPRFGTVADGVVFTRTVGAETQLWHSDGTAAGTTYLRSFVEFGNSFPSLGFTSLGSYAYFVADDGGHGSELWRTDGTLANTVLATDAIDSDSDPFPFGAIGDRYFFTATRPDTGRELWTTTGSTASTSLLEIAPGPADGGLSDRSATLGGSLLFGAQPGGQPGLWKTDGASRGTSLVFPVGVLSNIATMGGVAFFGGGPAPFAGELWRSDGTPGGTFQLVDQVPGSSGPDPHDFVALDDRVLFILDREADGSQDTLWRTDGTAAGTRRVTSFPCSQTTRVGARAFMACFEAVSGAELWVTEGTVESTRLVRNIGPPNPSLGRELVDVDGTLYFTSFDSFNGRTELWKSDGTAAGTVPVQDRGTRPLGVALLTPFHGGLFFLASTQESGSELWRSDGTSAGTYMVRDLMPGPVSGVALAGTALTFDRDTLTVVPGGVVFRGRSPDGGVELWFSDGTSPGTVPYAEIEPGLDSSSPTHLRTVGPRVFFDAIQRPSGNELWAVDFPGAVVIADASVVEPDSGSVAMNVPVSLTAPVASPVVVSYTTLGGTATAGVDFLPQSGALTFNPGSTGPLTVSIPVSGDLLDEPNETLTVLLNVTGAFAMDDRSLGVIVDDDGPTIAAGDATVVEGDAGTVAAVFNLTLATSDGLPVPSAQLVRFSTEGATATSGIDFVAQAGILTFAAGTPSGTAAPVTVPVRGDTFDEPDEFFRVRLEPVSDEVLQATVLTGHVLDDDGVDGAPPLELSRGAAVRATLAPPTGRSSDRDWYTMLQAPQSSYELVIDEVSGDAVPLEVSRMAADGSTVLQTAAPIGTGGALSLRWQNTGSTAIADEHISVASAACGTDCAGDDGYRLRFYETTLAAARYNNQGGQVTIVLLQNASDAPVDGRVLFRAGNTGALALVHPFTVPARGGLVLNTAALQVTAGSLTVTHDAPYGSLVGKAVALEPSTGFSFDTPMTYRPR